MNGKERCEEEEWVVRGSRISRHCVNLIRTIHEEVLSEAMEERNKDKELIQLSIGIACKF